MSEKTYKPQMPDLMEAVFDAAYLIFDFIAGILFLTLSNGNPLFILYGNFRKYKWLSHDKDGRSNYYFFRMLSAGNIVQ